MSGPELDQVNWVSSAKDNISYLALTREFRKIAVRGLANFRHHTVINGEVLLFSNTPKQRSIAEQLEQLVPTDVKVSHISDKVHFSELEHDWGKVEAYAWLLTPWVFLVNFWLRATGSKQHIRKHIYDHTRSVGAFVFYFFLLKRNRKALKLVAYSNDHNYYATSFIRAAQVLAIPTVFVQHAQVSEYFPALNHDLSLIFGKHSLGLYSKLNPVSGTVALVGNLAYDTIVKVPSKHTKCLGIGVGATDKIARIEAFIQIAIDAGFDVVLRPHPACDLLWWKSFCLSHDLKFSHSRESDIIEFFGEVERVVTSESTLVLDAAIAGKLVAIADFDWGYDRDYYHFEREGLVEHYLEIPTDLKEWLLSLNVSEELNRIKAALAHYDAIYTKRPELTTANCIAQLMCKALKGTEHDGEVKRKDGYDLIVFN